MPDTILRTLIIVTHLIFTVDLQSRYHYLLLLISTLYGWEDWGSERLSHPRSCCCCSVTKSCLTLCDPMDVSQCLLKCMSTELVMLSNHLILVTPFSFCRQSLSGSGSFPTSQFTSGGQSTGVSASASVLPMNIQGWFPLRLTGLISLQSTGLSRVFSSTTVGKHQFSGI